MSLLEQQKAAALLIRYPEKNRGQDLEPFLGTFDLNLKEKDQLRSLSRDRNVVKFGYSMSGVRWETISKNIKLAKNYLSADLLDRIFRTLFEPASAFVPLWNVSQAFFDFVLSDESTLRCLMEEAPPFAIDILRFERAQLMVWKKLREPSHIPEGSTLANSAFEFVDLEYDLLDLLNRGSSEAPQKRAVKLLLLPDAGIRECRFFEVDESLQNYLEGQLKEPVSSTPRPQDYEALVSLGICRALN